jgi:FAD-dependent urate hydroxylase
VEVTSSRRGLMVVGPQGLCGLMPAGEGLLQWWFDVRVSPGEPPPAAPVAMLRERFGDWGGQVREVLAAVDDAQVGFFPHVRHRVPAVWSAGRMTLVGDAAHSMPPTRAQGANQALEDAWTLARAVREAAGDVPAALRAYERERAPKAGLVARQAGMEDTNEYRPWMTRMVPNALASRYHERWLRQISTFLTA